MRRALAFVPLALIVGLLAGCSGIPAFMGASDGSAPDSMPGYSVSSGSDAGGFAEESIASNISGPQIITTVDITVTVTKPVMAADAAADIADRFGGSISHRSENAPTEYSNGSAQLTLRIPSAKLTQALDELKKLGVAQDTSINAVDVTAESTDLAARITSLQTSVDRLLTLMSQATSTENLLAVESALSARQAELESLQAQKRNLDDQVALSTVNIYLVSERDTPAPEPDNFWTGLIAGWNGFVAFWAGALVALGVLVPWLVAAGLLALVITVWVRRARRRRGIRVEETPLSSPDDAARAEASPASEAAAKTPATEPKKS